VSAHKQKRYVRPPRPGKSSPSPRTCSGESCNTTLPPNLDSSLFLDYHLSLRNLSIADLGPPSYSLIYIIKHTHAQLEVMENGRKTVEVEKKSPKEEAVSETSNINTFHSQLD
jgi:hypothetical protein